MVKSVQTFVKFSLLILFLFLSLESALGQCIAKIQAIPDSGKGCSGFGIQFRDISTGIHSRNWDFGDGTVFSTSQNPNKTFTSSGVNIYTTSLAIFCPLTGARDTAKYIVEVRPNPIATFSVTKSTVCSVSEQICVTNSSSSNFNARYLWDFGDLSTSTSNQPCHTYYSTGPVNIDLTVKNQYGCSSKSTQSIEVKESPNPEFDLSPFVGCVPLNVSYTNQTVDGSSPITDWLWDFGNGLSSTSKNPTLPLVLTSSGTYLVKLTATNAIGCTNFTINPMVVSPKIPVTLSAPTVACPNTSVTLSATASSLVSNFSWSVVDGIITGPSNGSTINVRWPTGGIKKIKVFGNANGCQTSDSATVTVSTLYTGSVSVTSGSLGVCKGQDVSLAISPLGMNQYSFKNGSTILSQSITNNTLNLTNVQNSISISPSFLDPNNCVVNLPVQNLTVSSKPNISLSTSTLACGGQNVSLVASPIGLSNYSFFVNYLPVQSSGSNTFLVSNIVSGTKAYVIGTNSTCDSTSNTITISTKDSIQPPQVNCGLSSTNFITFVWDSVANANQYEVKIGNGIYGTPSSGSTGVSHLVTGLNENDSLTITVRAFANPPCSNITISNSVTCYAKFCPTPLNFKLENDSVQCSGGSVQIRAKKIVVSTTNGYTFTYNGGLPTKDSIYIYSPVPAGQSTVLVILKDPTLPGCTPVTKSVLIKTLDPLALTLTGTKFCADTNITVTIRPGGLTNYSFYLDNVLKQSSEVPIFTFSTGAGIHTLSVLGVNKGCKAPVIDTTFDLENLIAPTFVLTPNDSLICGSSFQVSISPSGYANYLLFESPMNSNFDIFTISTTNSFGGIFLGEVIDPKNINKVYSHYFKVQYQNRFGCKSTISPPQNRKFTGNFPKDTVEGIRINNCSTGIFKTKIDTGYIKYNWKLDSFLESEYTVTTLNNGANASFSITNSGINIKYRTIRGTVEIFRNSTCSSIKEFISVGLPSPNSIPPRIECNFNYLPCGDTIKCIVPGEIDTSTVTINDLPINTLNDKIKWRLNKTLSNEFYFYYPKQNDTTFNVGYLKKVECDTSMGGSEIKMSRKYKRDNPIDTNSYCLESLSKGILLNQPYKYVRWKSISMDTTFNDTIKYSNLKLVDFIADTTTSTTIFRPIKSGKYNIKVWHCVDSLGTLCCDSYTYEFCIAECQEPFIANALSPNNDNINDTWNVINIKSPPAVQVFNRWGDKVFEDNSYKNNWEGTDLNKRPLADGVYLYSVKVNSKQFVESSDTIYFTGPNNSYGPDGVLRTLGYEPDSLVNNDPDEYNRLKTELFNLGLKYKYGNRAEKWRIQVNESFFSALGTSQNSQVDNKIYLYVKNKFQCKYRYIPSLSGTLLIQR